MAHAAPLSPAFIAALSARGAAPAIAPGEIEPCLVELVHRGREAWSTVPLDAELFVRHLAAKVRFSPGDPPPLLADALSALQVADLHLACACAQGDPEALALLERRFFPEIEAALRQRTRLTSAVDEILQELRTHLLVARPGEAPRIARYSGRGPLRAWLGVVAARLLVDHVRGRPREQAGEEELLDLPAPRPDPELDYVQRHYGEEFRAAFRGALAGLGERDRNLLRYHFLDGLSQEQIGRIYQAPRSTIQRWIEAARGAVLDATRRRLRERLKVSAAELDSLLRAVDGGFDASLGGLLRGGG